MVGLQVLVLAIGVRIPVSERLIYQFYNLFDGSSVVEQLAVDFN